MSVVPIYLDIDEKTYAGVKAGVLELCGLAKNVDNKRVAKHIPAVADSAKEGASKAEAEEIKTKLEAEGAEVNLK